MEDLSETFGKAQSLVEDLPEHLQPVAFQKALEHQLGPARTAPPENEGGEKSSSPGGNAAGSSTDDVDRVPPAHIVADGTVKEKVAWAVVQLTSRGETATTRTVREHIDVSFSSKKPGRTTVSAALGSLSPRYLSRMKSDEGQAYVYEPTERVVQVFEDDEE